MTPFVRDDRGTSALEYAFLAALIAVAIIATLFLVRDGVRSLYQSVAQATSGS